jgi:hypothetical protein
MSTRILLAGIWLRLPSSCCGARQTAMALDVIPQHLSPMAHTDPHRQQWHQRPIGSAKSFHNCFYYVNFCSYFLLSYLKLSRKWRATTHNNSHTLGHVCFFLCDLSTSMIRSMCKALSRQWCHNPTLYGSCHYVANILHTALSLVNKVHNTLSNL